MQQGTRPSPPISRLVRAGTALVVVAIVLTAGVAVSTVATTSRTSNFIIDHIGPLRTDNALLLRNLIDAETGLRGYQISGDPDTLEPYRTSRQSIPPLVSAMRELARPNDRWAAHVGTLAALIEDWFDTYAFEVIERIEAGDPEAASVERVAEGKALVDRVRAVNTRFDRELLDERRERQDLLDRTTVLAIGAIGATLLLALGALVWRARRVGQSVTRPLQDLEAAVVKVEAGADRLPGQIQGAREVEHLATVIDEMAHRTATLAAANADRLQEERLIRHLTRRIRESLGRDDVLERAAEVLGSAAGAERVVVLSVDDGHTGEVLVEWSRAREPKFGPGQVLPRDRALDEDVARLVSTRATLVVDDVATSDQLSESGRSLLQSIGVQAALLAPAVTGGDASALIAVLSSTPTQWSRLAATAATAAADDLATALAHARLYEREQEMVERLRGLDQAKTDFVSSVSHELRTPLTSIRGFVELLRDGEAGELQAEQDRMLAVVERNSERLLVLIEDLLTLSRVESGTYRTTLVRLDLRDVVRSAIDALGPQAAARQVRLELAVDEIPRVQGDPTQLERVVLNVLTNAIKFSEEGGRVRVTVRAEDGVVVEITDDGIGIPETEQAELFTRFFRSSTAQERAIPGTGLGLVIVQSIVERHGGTVDLTSAAGSGTTVRIHLPTEPAIVGP